MLPPAGSADRDRCHLNEKRGVNTHFFSTTLNPILLLLSSFFLHFLWWADQWWHRKFRLSGADCWHQDSSCRSPSCWLLVLTQRFFRQVHPESPRLFLYFLICFPSFILSVSSCHVYPARWRRSLPPQGFTCCALDCEKAKQDQRNIVLTNRLSNLFHYVSYTNTSRKTLRT